jgi:hypothetical protein
LFGGVACVSIDSSVNLTVFQILGFDIILRMDWLLKYYANIDYRKK